MTLDSAGEAATFRATDDVDHLTVGKLIDEHLVAHVRAVWGAEQTKLFENPRRRNAAAGLLEMTAHWLGDVLQSYWFLVHQTELHGIVTVRTCRSFLLHHDAWTSLDDGHWCDRAVLRKDLRHADFS